MKLLIVEPEATGHHMSLYTRLLVREAISNNWKIQILTTQRALNHPSFQLVKDELKGEADIFMMKEVHRTHQVDSFALICQQLAYYNAIKKGFSQIISNQLPDFIYVLNLDYFDKVLAFLGSPFGNLPFSGMLMTINYHRHIMKIGTPSRNDQLYKYLFHRVLRIPKLKLVAVIDDMFVEYTNQFPHNGYKKIRFVPDVGKLTGKESQKSAREKLGIPQENFLILVYGSLTRRKNIENLLRAVDLTSNKTISILLAGVQDENIQRLLSTPLAQSLIARKQIFESNHFHDDSEEYCVFKAADAVWVGYEKRFQGSSGVLLQAAIARHPVLASSYGLIGKLVDQYGLGLRFDPNNINQISSAITKLLSDSNLRESFQQNGSLLAEKHSTTNFQKALKQLISEGSKNVSDC